MATSSEGYRLNGVPLHESNAVGIQLFRHARMRGEEQLLACEATMFVDGARAVDTVLRRAAISGRVEIEGEIKDHFLDLKDYKGDIVGTVALDAKSYSAIKNKWARTKLERTA